jgi:hypothetical protein
MIDYKNYQPKPKLTAADKIGIVAFFVPVICVIILNLL